MSAATPTAPDVAGLSLPNTTACAFAAVLRVMRAIERLGSPRATQTGMIGPMRTILMGVLLLDEPFTPGLAAGTSLVLSGVWRLARAR